MNDVEVVEAIYRALAARDPNALFALINDRRFVVTQDHALPWGGRYAGHDGLADFALRLADTIDSAVTTDALFAADGDVIQCGRTRGTVRANGATFDIPEVHRWTISDGQAVGAHFSIDTPAMLAVLRDPDDVRRYAPRRG
jgi:uncharacterized protein